MQAILCDNELDAPPMPLGTIEHPIMRPQHADQPPEHTSEDLSQFDYEFDDDPYRDWKYLLIEQISAESLEECSKSGHPRQAWLILSGKTGTGHRLPHLRQDPRILGPVDLRRTDRLR